MGVSVHVIVAAKHQGQVRRKNKKKLIITVARAINMRNWLALPKGD